MGFVKKLFAPSKPQPVAQAAPQASGESEADIAAKETKKKNAAILALNAGKNNGASTIGGSNASVTSKTLLGL